MNQSPEPPDDARDEPRPESRRHSDGVLLMGALLLAAVVIGVVLFWNNLLKKREPAVKPLPNAQESREAK